MRSLVSDELRGLRKRANIIPLAVSSCPEAAEMSEVPPRAVSGCGVPWVGRVQASCTAASARAGTGRTTAVPSLPRMGSYC